MLYAHPARQNLGGRFFEEVGGVLRIPCKRAVPNKAVIWEKLVKIKKACMHSYKGLQRN